MTTDRERIFYALVFYIERCTWASGDEEKDEYKRLLDIFREPGPVEVSDDDD